MLKKILVILLVIISVIICGKVLIKYYIYHREKKLIALELKEKYGEEFKVKKIIYNRYNGEIREVVVVPVSNKNIKFHIPKYYIELNNYLEEIWNYNLEKELEKEINIKYEKSIVSSDIILQNKDKILITADEIIPKEKQKDIVAISNYIEKCKNKINPENEIEKKIKNKDIKLKINVGIYILKKYSNEDKVFIEKINELIRKKSKDFMITLIFLNDEKIKYNELKEKLIDRDRISEIPYSGDRNRIKIYKFLIRKENYEYINKIVISDNTGIKYNENEFDVYNINESFFRNIKQK